MHAKSLEMLSHCLVRRTMFDALHHLDLMILEYSIDVSGDEHKSCPAHLLLLTQEDAEWNVRCCFLVDPCAVQSTWCTSSSVISNRSKSDVVSSTSSLGLTTEIPTVDSLKFTSRVMTTCLASTSYTRYAFDVSS